MGKRTMTTNSYARCPLCKGAPVFFESDDIVAIFACYDCKVEITFTDPKYTDREHTYTVTIEDFEAC